MKFAYVSGHLDLTPEEFEEHYVPKLQAAVERRDWFVVGDAKGADTMTQAWLHEQQLAATVTVVCHMFGSPRNNVGNFQTVSGFVSDEARDAYMTAQSDYDIAWVRPGREESGTAKNLARRSANALNKALDSYNKALQAVGELLVLSLAEN